MMMDDKDLEKLLSDMARNAPEPSADLLGRVLGDAYEAQPEPAAGTSLTSQSTFQNVLNVLGGWGGLGGLAMAASVGFVIGFNPPALFQAPFGLVLSDEVVDYDASVSGFGWDLEEG